ncbi:ABC transporter ATP-binding protein [Rhodococcus opacus]|uniref:Dipeptide ABC transporter ATP-binding protein DppD n=1 Tax=Rhodococcus opacus TaxID=37919 RepID=A0A2S8J4R0_RHOOP|nr:ABC transporter ATP-binding protein [Rhodococcus opacus]PQP21985.1 dipeptide ABC transporter ATP-binding protein DppD [Rhodococcus opacus]
MTITDGLRMNPGTGTRPVFEVKNLSIQARKSKHTTVPILQDVNFSIAEREVLGLVGESGSGKTVTSLAAMRLLPKSLEVTSGSIEFDGRDLLTLPAAELRSIRGSDMAMIFQDALRCLNPAYTIGDQIAEPLRTHRGMSKRQAHARAVELLELVEIPRAAERASAYPHELSGGMCQRVMIAIALSCSPKLLIADEPTTALDVTVQKQVLRLLERLQADLGLAVLFITHDLGVVAEVCHRTAVMYAGQVVEIGGKKDLFVEPYHPYTSGLISSVPTTDSSGDRRFGSIRGSVPQPGSWPTGCHFFNRCDHGRAGRCDVGPIPLELVASGRRKVRCARVDELELKGFGQ